MGNDDDPARTRIAVLEFGVEVGEFPFSHRCHRPKHIAPDIRTRGTRGIKDFVGRNSPVNGPRVTRRAVLHKFLRPIEGKFRILRRELKRYG